MCVFVRRVARVTLVAAMAAAGLAAAAWLLPTYAFQQATPPSAEYAGMDTCLNCHAEKADSLKGTPHGRASNPRSPSAGHG